MTLKPLARDSWKSWYRDKIGHPIGYPFSLGYLSPFLLWEKRSTRLNEWASEQVHELTRQLEQRREILARDIAQTTAAEAGTTIRTHHISIGKLSFAFPSVPALLPVIGTNPVVFSNQTYPPVNAAFILFNKQIAAHIAAQTLTHDEPYCMSASQKYIAVAPEDVIWENLAMNHYDRQIRFALSWAITIGLILARSIPGRSHPI